MIYTCDWGRCGQPVAHACTLGACSAAQVSPLCCRMSGSMWSHSCCAARRSHAAATGCTASTTTTWRRRSPSWCALPASAPCVQAATGRLCCLSAPTTRTGHLMPHATWAPPQHVGHASPCHTRQLLNVTHGLMLGHMRGCAFLLHCSAISMRPMLRGLRLRLLAARGARSAWAGRCTT